MADVWIGLFEVVPRPGIEFDGGGAFVQVVAQAASEADYVDRARAALAEAGFDAAEVEDVYPLGPEWPPADAEPSIIEAVRDAVERDEVGWGDWHTFPREDR